MGSLKSLKSVEDACVQYNGPGRLVLRRFLEGVFGVERNGDLSLDDFRLKGEKAQQREEQQIKAHDIEGFERARSSISSPRRKEEPLFHRESGLDEVEEQNDSAASRSRSQHTTGASTQMFHSNVNEPSTHATVSKTQVIPEGIHYRPFSQFMSAPNLYAASGSGDAQGQRERFYTAEAQPIPAMDPVIPSPSTLRFRDSLPPERSRYHRINPQNKKRKTEEDEADLGKDSATSAKRKRRGSSFSLTRVALCLDGKRQGVCYHLAKCCSISRSTIASRLSSTFSARRIRTNDSEFKQYYANPGMRNTRQASLDISRTSTDSLPTPCTFEQSPEGPESVAIAFLIEAYIQDLSDIDVESRIKGTLPARENERKNFVNASDNRGVSPLHLAVAYGYPGTCALLMENGADPKALTLKGTAIPDFAKPAERLAGRSPDLSLYTRVLHCRMFVREGEQPLAAGRLSRGKVDARKQRKGGKQKQSNRGTISRELFAGSGVERSGLNNQGSGSSASGVSLPSRSMTMESSTATDPISRAFLIGSSTSFGNPGLPRFTDSPVPASIHRNDSGAMSDFRDFAFPNAVNLGAITQVRQMPARRPEPPLSYMWPSVPGADIPSIATPNYSQPYSQPTHSSATFQQANYGLSFDPMYPSTNTGINMTAEFEPPALVQQPGGNQEGYDYGEEFAELLLSQQGHGMTEQWEQWEFGPNWPTTSYVAGSESLPFSESAAYPSQQRSSQIMQVNPHSGQQQVQYGRNTAAQRQNEQQTEPQAQSGVPSEAVDFPPSSAGPSFRHENDENNHAFDWNFDNPL